MNIAGESAGRKNRCNAFNIPITATATATVVRNGIMIRVSCVVSASFPGTAANSPPDAIVRVIGSANTMARTTIAPVATSSALMTRLPRRHAASRPRVWRVFVNVGTKAAVMAPSAKRSRTRLGTRNATLKASMAGVAEAPNRLARHHFPDDPQQPARHRGDADEARGSGQSGAHRFGEGAVNRQFKARMS